MSGNYDPPSASGKYSITSQFPLLVGQLPRYLNSSVTRTDLPPERVIRSSLSHQDTYPEARVVDHFTAGIFQSSGFNFMTRALTLMTPAVLVWLTPHRDPGACRCSDLLVMLALCDVWCITHFYWILRGANALLLQHRSFMRSRCYSDFGNVYYLRLEKSFLFYYEYLVENGPL